MASLTLQNLAASAPSQAEQSALENWARNLAALAQTQRRLPGELRAQRVSVAEWLFARDGSLTAFSEPDRWWAGCSLPQRAAAKMLQTLEVSGIVACLLDPSHASHVRVALEKLRPQQAVISVHQDLSQLAIALHCHDFTNDIIAGRLWFAWGENWPEELAKVLEENPGLPTPSSFIRLPVTAGDVVERMVARAQQVFSDEGARRGAALDAAQRAWSARAAEGRSRICVIAPSHFQLWSDAGAVLAEALRASDPGQSVEWVCLDTDRPSSASPLALIAAAADCDGVVSADVSRGDAANVLPAELPWITWLTTPRIPPAAGAGPKDVLLLADPAWQKIAWSAGWDTARVKVAGWPDWLDAGAEEGAADPHVALIADTHDIAPDKRLDDYSSHRLLWEALADEIAANAFAIGVDPDLYLTQKMRQASIDDASFDRRLFVGELIIPAYQQGLARLLLRHDVPLKLYGRGWDRIGEFTSVAAGPVTTRQALRAAVRSAAAVIHPLPSGTTHALDGTGRKIIRAGEHGLKSLLAVVRECLARQDHVPGRGPHRLQTALLLEVLGK